jgi:hypothetical protein
MKYTHVYLYCKKLLYTNIIIPKHPFFNTNKIIINKNLKNNNEYEVELKYNFFYSPPEKFFTKKFINDNFDYVTDLLKKITNINLENLDYEKYKNSLVMHIRSGDIFDIWPHPRYVPPPLYYYENIINKNKYDEIIIVSENDTNPIINILKNKYKNVKFSKRSLLEDINIILSSTNLCLSVGTFIPSLLLLSNNKKNI